MIRGSNANFWLINATDLRSIRDHYTDCHVYSLLYLYIIKGAVSILNCLNSFLIHLIKQNDSIFSLGPTDHIPLSHVSFIDRRSQWSMAQKFKTLDEWVHGTIILNRSDNLYCKNNRRKVRKWKASKVVKANVTTTVIVGTMRRRAYDTLIGSLCLKDYNGGVLYCRKIIDSRYIQDINKNILILYTTTYTDATDAIARSPLHDLFVAYSIGLGLDYSSWSDRLRRDELIASVKWLASIERSGYRVGCICVRGTYTHVCINIYRKQRSKTNIFLLISRKLWLFGNSEQHRCNPSRHKISN